MNIVINYLKKRKKYIKLNIYFARLTMSLRKKEQWKFELIELNRALFFLTSINDNINNKKNQKKTIIELISDAEKLNLYS